MKVSLLEKENFELRGQLIDKLLIIKQLKTDSKSNLFPRWYFYSDKYDHQSSPNQW